jgi:endonuclease III
VGVIFDQGIPYERAWAAPHLLKQRLGHFSVRRIAATPMGELRRAVRQAPALHRYVGKLPLWIKAAARKLVKEYDGDAANIWEGCLTAGEVIERLDDFPGIGQKKAHMAARILQEDGREFHRWDQINVAVDVHVRRVWKRAGLVRNTSTATIMATATRLWPKFPGELDFPTWWIGTTWCHGRGADCQGERHDDGRRCPLVRVCPKIGVHRL